MFAFNRFKSANATMQTQFKYLNHFRSLSAHSLLLIAAFFCELITWIKRLQSANNGAQHQSTYNVCLNISRFYYSMQLHRFEFLLNFSFRMPTTPMECALFFFLLDRVDDMQSRLFVI